MSEHRRAEKNHKVERQEHECPFCNAQKKLLMSSEVCYNGIIRVSDRAELHRPGHLAPRPLRRLEALSLDVHHSSGRIEAFAIPMSDESTAVRSSIAVVDEVHLHCHRRLEPRERRVVELVAVCAKTGILHLAPPCVELLEVIARVETVRVNLKHELADCAKINLALELFQRVRRTHKADCHSRNVG